MIKINERALLTNLTLEYKNDFTQEELDKLGDFLDSVSRRLFKEENLKGILARRK